jgi:type I restriction enzyme S subunit
MNPVGHESSEAAGTRWLGEVPSHWQVTRLKNAADCRVSNVDKVPGEGEEPVRLCNYTDVYYREHLHPNLDLMQTTATTAEIRRFHLQVGDVVITKDSEEWSDIAVPALVIDSAPDLVCGYHLAIVRPRPSRLYGPFLQRLFQAAGVNTQLQVSASGITRYSLPKSAIGEVVIPLPPVDDQRAIADFLDRETATIDRLLKQKQRFLQLIDDSRRAVVAQAVTRGIRATPLKPSGVEWFGSVPEHWTISRLGRLALEINDVNHEMPDAVEDGVPFLSAKDFKDDGSLNFSEDVKLISREAFARLGAKITPKRGDIVYSRYGACLGKARLVETDQEFLVSYSCVTIRLRKNVADPRYFTYLLDSDLVLTDARLRTQGIAVPDLGNKMIAKFAVPVPPLDEQREIAAWLDEKVSELRRLSDTIASAIGKVQELRVALISAAVTGRIDVRNYRPQEAAALCQ